jgi:hypothetical protein
MSITLIVEDGTGLANSNTYVAVSDVRAYCASLGFDTVGNDPDNPLYSDDTIASKLLIAMQWLSMQSPWIGVPLKLPLIDPTTGQYTAQQALAWPRQATEYAVLAAQMSPDLIAAYSYRLPLVPTGVPTGVKNCQCQLVLDQLQGINILPSSANGGQPLVTSNKFDVFSTSFNVSGMTDKPKLPVANNFIADLLGNKAPLKAFRA